MRRLLHIALVVLLGLCAGTRLSQAQDTAPPPAERVEAVRAAYERFDYDAAEAQARAALADFAAFTPAQLVELHTLLGVIAFIQDQLPTARTEFEAALSIEPDLRLDPLLFPPKIVDFVDEVRDAYQARQPAPTETMLRYVPVYDPRPAAAVRSLVVPGWGQHYKGQPTKGWVLLGTWGALAGGTVWTHLERQSARDAYLAASFAEVEDRYATYNRWHKARNSLALATALVWGYSYLDALLQPIAPEQLRLTPLASPTATGFQVEWRF
ncbi:MAG: DUF5683 domain-containing protein [Bacteroidota bacterium]